MSIFQGNIFPGSGGSGGSGAVFNGATSSQDGTTGAVPKPIAGQQALYLRGDATWAVPGGGGNVIGPGSATDNAIVRFDGTTGGLIQNSAITISDSGTLSGVLQINAQTLNRTGGDLTIETTTSGNVVINGATATTIQGLKYPTVDGTSGQVLTTDGLGTLTFQSSVDNSYTIVQDDGVDLTQRLKLNFVGATVTAVDDSANARTNVTFAASLNSLATFNTNGLITQTAANTYTGRTVTGTANVITVTNGNGVSGNPTITIANTYAGQTSITTLGTINAGTWQGTPLAQSFGGTGGTDQTTGFDALSPTNTKGDVIAHNGTNNVRLGVGADGTIIVADSAQTTGLKYSTLSSAGALLKTNNLSDVSSTSTALSNLGGLPLAGGTMTGNLILDADPTLGLQAATKQYVDSIAAGLSLRANCRVATTGALNASYSVGTSGVGATLTNAGTQVAISIDGVTLSAGNRVLVKDQVSTANNGIYSVTTVGTGSTNWVLTRTTDFDADGEIEAGAYTIINEGNANATQLYIETGIGPFTVGTTAIIFSALTSVASITASGGLQKLGNNISVVPNTFLTTANNLSDLTSTASARTNLGVAIGTNVQAYNAQLDGVVALSGTGIVVHTGTNTFTERTLAGTNNRVLVNNGSGVSGNPSIDIDANYVGQASITTLGTVTTGTWNGTAIPIANGGTGAATTTAAFNALSPVTTKGDLITRDSTNNIRLGVGANGYILTADSTQTSGIKWAPVPNGFVFNTVTINTAMAVAAGYIPNSTSTLTLTLPAIANPGDVIEIVGQGSGGWVVAQNAGQVIHFGNLDTTTGVSGSLASQVRYDCVKLVCIVANTDFVVSTASGTLTTT